MIEIRCKGCNRKLGDFTHVSGTIRCPKCGEDVSVNVVDQKSLTQSFYSDKKTTESVKP